MTDDRIPPSSYHPPDASEIEIESGVGFESRLGYVNLTWGNKSGQLTTREARAHAMAILDAASAADHDASVLRFLMRNMAMDQAGAATLLLELRKARQSIDRESGNS